MKPEIKALLIEQFSSYLDEADTNMPDGASEATSEEDGQIDLYSLFVELAALRNEVKLESRHVKAAFDEFDTLFATLQSSHERLGKELERNRITQEALQRSVLRPLLLELLELHDRLEAGAQSLQTLPPARLAWLKKRELAQLDSVREGQQISLRRLQSVLQRYQVNAFPTQGEPVNPQIARVVEVAHEPSLDNGIVIEELRKGFYWDDELLRPAEVKVNKRET